MSDTPETDAFIDSLNDDWDYEFAALTAHAKKLEQERDEAQKENMEQALLLGKGGEREAALLAKLETAELEIRRIREGYQGTCYACECVGELNQKYRDLVLELIRLLEIEEESDSGSVFRPNKISSCRVMDGMQMNQCLKALKELAQE